MKLKLQVTLEDIEANAHHAFDCPISRAFNRILKPEFRAGTGGGFVDIFVDSEVVHRISICELVHIWYMDYDRDNIKAQPIEFEVEIPDEYLKL